MALFGEELECTPDGLRNGLPGFVPAWSLCHAEPHPHFLRRAEHTGYFGVSTLGGEHRCGFIVAFASLSAR